MREGIEIEIKKILAIEHETEQRGIIFTYNKTENTEVKSEIKKKVSKPKELAVVFYRTSVSWYTIKIRDSVAYPIYTLYKE